MNECSTANIKQIISSYESFTNICEETHWVKRATTEEVKSAFKLGLFIEKSVESFELKKTSSKWFAVIGKQLKNCKDIGFYKLACDQVLAIFFKCDRLSVNILDIAVRMYTSMFTKERFKSFLKSLLQQSFSNEAILNFALLNVSSTSDLQSELLINDWVHEIENNKSQKVKETVLEMLGPYKVVDNLELFIGVLALSDNLTESRLVVQNIILEQLLKKMPDRSILSKNFWATMLKIDKSILMQVCEKHKEFLVALTNFIIYIGSMMDCTKNGSEEFWACDPSSTLCLNIGYKHILDLVLNISKKNYKFIVERIKEAEGNTGSKLWTKILCDLGSNLSS